MNAYVIKISIFPQKSVTNAKTILQLHNGRTKTDATTFSHRAHIRSDDSWFRDYRCALNRWIP
jgi:hypothetical protein